ncbi:MAG: PQQ-binding-like beta-propeller repeat protein [Planctomycetia bacterium]|nr:PQQ-binding-like beta-propeller repeat protein [Planctomycetia bacterium]
MTSNVIWRSAELTDNSAYSSVLPVTIDGVRQYLFVTSAAVGGLNPADGSLFWKTDYPDVNLVACDPIYFNGIVFMSEGYKVGGYAWRVQKAKEGNGFSVESAYKLRKVDNKHHGLLAVDNFLYSSTERGSFVCVDLSSGKIQWEERRMRGKASAVFADGKLILRKENTGEIILMDPNPKKYTEISRFKQPERSSKNAWTYPLVVDKKLYLRDQDKIFCFDLADSGSAVH